MAKPGLKIVIALFLTLVLALPSVAQQPEEISESANGLSGPRKQLSIIIFSGLAGAVLGLSTLSFYGRPQEKLSNIAIGAAIGIIGGATFTTYKAATDPYETLGAGLEKNQDWRFAQLEQRPAPTVTLQWTF